MRVLTVSELKKEDNRKRNDYPTPGTFAWEVWKRLEANKGHAVELTTLANSVQPGRFHYALAQLQDMYGLDIRRLRPYHHKYILAGEWFGSHYTDYCAAAFHAGEE
jgi:hypothetical protein